MTIAQQRNHQTTHFSECIPVVMRRVTVLLKHLLSCDWSLLSTPQHTAIVVHSSDIAVCCASPAAAWWAH